MFPDFRYLLQSLFHTQMPEWLGLFKTFGLMVAMSFIAAAWATGQELRRKEKQGLLLPEYKNIEVGRPISINELILSVITGFLLGFKIGGVFGHVQEVSPDPMGYLLSMKGNLLFGLAAAVLYGYTKYAEGKKQELPEPKIKTIAIYPHDLIMEIVMVAAIGGLAGAKLFNAFETWSDFIQHPIQNLTSSSGLTFLGGLIVATTCFHFFARRHKIPFKHLSDAAAPGIMLAYGIGRLGCQLAGDGDWGIYNTAYISDASGKLKVATATDNAETMHMIGNSAYANIKAPSWLPDWLFGMTYPHNVGNEGRAILNCAGDYCNVLPVSVFPTPIYEAVICIGLFFVLWMLRSKLTGTLQIFGAYLVFAGIERFCVELIRVNYKYDWGFIHPSQAEIISVILVFTGSYLLFLYKDKPLQVSTKEKSE